MFRAVLCDAFLSENLRLAHIRYYLPDSAKTKPQVADGNEVLLVGSGLSWNPRKSLLVYCRRLAGLDPNPCCVPDFAEQVPTHVVKAGLTEIQEDHYKVCWPRACVRFLENSIPRYERDVPVHRQSCSSRRNDSEFSAQLMQPPPLSFHTRWFNAEGQDGDRSSESGPSRVVLLKRVLNHHVHKINSRDVRRARVSTCPLVHSSLCHYSSRSFQLAPDAYRNVNNVAQASQDYAKASRAQDIPTSIRRVRR